MEHKMNWGKNIVHERFQKVLEYLKYGEKILDIGTGRGVYVNELNKLGFMSIGMDIVKYQEWTKTNNQFIVSSSNKLPFRNKCFDISIAFEVMEHVENYQEMLAEIRRCTKNYFILSVPNCELDNKLREYDLALAHWVDKTHVNFFTKDFLIKTLNDNHFDILFVEDCYKISVSNYYWDTLRAPRLIRNFLKFLIYFKDLSETYWSSILIVGRIQ